MTLDGPIVPLVVIVASVSLFLLRTRLVPHNTPVLVATIVATVVIALWLELQMGRTPVYRHGPVRLWSGDITSDQNSQQIFDPYSFTHIVHGPIFYGLTRLIAPAATPGTVATAVISLEAAWEASENTDQVINRYRSETVSLGLRGSPWGGSSAWSSCSRCGSGTTWRSTS